MVLPESAKKSCLAVEECQEEVKGTPYDGSLKWEIEFEFRAGLFWLDRSTVKGGAKGDKFEDDEDDDDDPKYPKPIIFSSSSFLDNQTETRIEFHYLSKSTR